jgi:hypothetical protein
MVGIIVCADVLVGWVLKGVSISPTADMLIDRAALSTCTAIAPWFVVLAPLRGDSARERGADSPTGKAAAGGR